MKLDTLPSLRLSNFKVGAKMQCANGDILTIVAINTNEHSFEGPYILSTVGGIRRRYYEHGEAVEGGTARRIVAVYNEQEESNPDVDDYYVIFYKNHKTEEEWSLVKKGRDIIEMTNLDIEIIKICAMGKEVKINKNKKFEYAA